MLSSTGERASPTISLRTLTPLYASIPSLAITWSYKMEQLWERMGLALQKTNTIIGRRLSNRDQQFWGTMWKSRQTHAWIAPALAKHELVTARRSTTWCKSDMAVR